MSDKGQGGDRAEATVRGGCRRWIWFNMEPNHGLILKPGSGMGWVTHLGKQYLGMGILTGTRCDGKVGFCGITELVQKTLSWSCLMVLHSWGRSRSWGCTIWSQPGTSSLGADFHPSMSHLSHTAHKEGLSCLLIPKAPRPWDDPPSPPSLSSSAPIGTIHILHHSQGTSTNTVGNL